jgi:hypothetical protein
LLHAELIAAVVSNKTIAYVPTRSFDKGDRDKSHFGHMREELVSDIS